MSIYVWPVLFTLLAWWFSTGAILYLNGLARWTHKWTMLFTTIVLGLAFAGLVATRDDTRITGAYLAFVCALMVWAWQEVAFLLGYVTGPRRTACPPGLAGWRRFNVALQALLHHEIALIVLLTAVAAVTWGHANSTGLQVYVVLWVMRQSAKLNVFLGVRNLNESWLPPHLQYLQTYFRRAPMNALFPVSVVVSTWFAVLMWQAATADRIDAYQASSLGLSATLLSLAVLEHWFLVLPLPTQALWRWAGGMRIQATEATPQA